MTTARQLAANRENAKKSTGPKSETGKNAARKNALRHGLAGQGEIVPPEVDAAVAARLDAWGDSYDPATAEEHWLYRQVVVHSILVDRCQREAFALADHHARRAAGSWDEDRAADAADLGARLARDPARVLSRLLTTRHGCDWLIGRWTLLAALLEDGRAWGPDQHAAVADLLGIPTELRDPSEAFAAGPGSAEGLELAREQVADLERRKAEALDDLDAFERGAAEAGVPVVLPREIRTLRRYEAACLKRYDWARARLRETARPAGRPEPAPAPRPSPSAAAPAQAPKAPAPEALEQALAPPPRLRDAIAPAVAPVRENRRTRRARERLARSR